MRLQGWAPDSGHQGILYLKRCRLVRPVDRIERVVWSPDVTQKPVKRDRT
mgnify:CR=1